jgi:hypothetical protein
MKRWPIKTDNAFAKGLFSVFKHETRFAVPTSQIPKELCEMCEEFRDKLSCPVFTKEYSAEDLKKLASENKCDLYGLLWSAFLESAKEFRNFPEVVFQRSPGVESVLTMNGEKNAVLSICRDLGKLLE